MKDRLVAKRFFNIVIMLLVTLLVTCAMAVAHDLFFDEILLYLVLDLLFFVLFVFALEYERKQRHLSDNEETTFRLIQNGYLFSGILLLLSSFFPEFLKPVLLVPLLMTACSNLGIGMCTGIQFVVMMALVSGIGTLELTEYCLLTVLGCITAAALEKKQLHFWYVIIMICISAALPGIFYYLTYREAALSQFLYGAEIGFAAAMFLVLFYPKLVTAKQSELANILDDIIEEDYPLSRELLSFSKADYEHARRVSRLAEKCAARVGADQKVCAAAGFYYRIGILDGDAIAENGIRIAQRECFPAAVTRIISEYNGEKDLPSGIESAIVHMVDGLIKKLELFDDTTMSSDWNQDMVIYQTLNDFSAQGLYDKSGLGMNMFLSIREYLVNEKIQM